MHTLKDNLIKTFKRADVLIGNDTTPEELADSVIAAIIKFVEDTAPAINPNAVTDDDVAHIKGFRRGVNAYRAELISKLAQQPPK